MKKPFFNHRVALSSSLTIYLGNIADIFRRVTGKQLPESYTILKPDQIPSEMLQSLFSREEIKKIARFKTLKKQAEWISGRYLIKHALRAIKPQLTCGEITIGYKEEGAPFINDFPEIAISLSHSGRYSALMISSTEQNCVAIDIEEMVPKKIKGIMGVAFTPEEQSSIIQLDEDAQLFQFYKIWTGKEAYLKYIERGFHEPLKNIEIRGDQIYHHRRRQHLKLITFCYENHFISYIINI